MSRKTANPTEAPSMVGLPWMDPVWTESVDRFGSRFTDTLATANQEAISCAESMVDDHLAFMRKRLNADFEAAKDLASCRDPGDAAKVVINFWSNLFSDYADAGERRGQQMSEYLGEAWSATTEVTETAMEAANSAEATMTSIAKKTAA